jgi:hypothetical protein
MPIEIDHFFICTDVGAPEADRLIEFGLVEGSPNRHPGQGTANRRFFFHNAFLELLWVENAAEAQSDVVRRTGLWDRWSRRGGESSPFGIGFRSAPGAAANLPFPSREYRPAYLPEPLAIHMADSSEVSTEPLLFFLPFGRRPDSADLARCQPRDHPAGVRIVTRLVLVGKQNQPKSAALRATEGACEGLRFVSGSEYRLEVGFDEEKHARSVDFRPTLPLILRW